MKQFLSVKIFFILSLLLLVGCQIKTNKQTSVSPLNNWQTYIDSQHKITFSYPSDWQLMPEINDDDLLTFSLQKEAYQIAVRAENNPKNLSPLDFELKLFISESREEMKKNYETVTIGKYQAVQQSGPVTPPGSGPMTSITFAPQNSKAYSFTYSANATPETHEKYLPEFNQILTSLKFSP